MNTEEKARAYDEALERARKIHNENVNNELLGFPEQIREIFPELRESEDERINKFLRHTFTAQYLCKDKTGKWHGEPVTNILSYLEKQKDHFRDDTKKVEKQDYSGLNDLERAIHRGFLVAGVENVPVAIIKGTANECKRTANENAEWSEEDEIKLASLINYFEGGALDCSTEDMVRWLKSLRPQYHGDVTMTEAYKMGLEVGKASSWKPSEDEERLINTSISFLKDFADKGYENAVECIDWLKSKLNGNSCK